MPLCPVASFCCSMAGTYFCSIYPMWVSLTSWIHDVMYFMMFGGFSAITALHILSASFSTSLSAKPNYICVKLPDIIPQLLDFSVLFLSLFYFSLCVSVLVISTKLSANALTLLNYVKSIDEHNEIFFSLRQFYEFYF